MTIDVQPADYDIESLAPGEAVAIDWTGPQYFADRTCQTNSGLGLLLNDPEGYRDHAAGKQIFPEDTPALLRGTRVHLAILEPEKWRHSVVMPEPARPPGVRKGTTKHSEWMAVCQRYQTAIAKLRASGQAPIVIDAGKRQHVEDMAEQVRTHPFARELLALDGKAEQTVVWREPTTGILAKVRVDWLAWVDEETAARVPGLEYGWAVSDVKTTRDIRPGPFWKSARKFGYFRQGAIYSDAVQAIDGKPVTHYLMAVKSEWRYSAGCWRMTSEDIEKGRTEYMRALRVLMRRRFTGEWDEPWQTGCPMLTPPWRGE